MPPKKLKRIKHLNEKKIVTSTLLTISIKVDNYIYTKEPIPWRKAKTYLQEIEKLKIEHNDIRSRQVSEKLTSILKGVIDEHLNKDITTTDKSTDFSSNLNIEDKVNKDFESNKALDITEPGEALVMATDTVPPQNYLVESINMDDQKDIHNNINTPINNMCKDSQNEGVLVNEENNENIILKETSVADSNNNLEYNDSISESKIQITNEEIINKNKKPRTIKKKTVCKKKIQSDNESTNSVIISKENITETSRNKTTKSKKKIIDLAWMENIKFFREINIDEHVASNLEETFWSDLSMPANCNLDFETE